MENLTLILDAYQKLTFEEKNEFLSEMNGEYNGEYMKIDLLRQRALLAQELMKLSNDDGTPYLKVNWIVKHILKITDEELLS